MSQQNREWSRVVHLRKAQSFRKVMTVYNTINSGSRNPNSFPDIYSVKLITIDT